MSARKLSNEDVVEIFRCIDSNRVPEKRLTFQIIVVGSNGMKLSPPSYKFEGKEWSKVEILQAVLTTDTNSHTRPWQDGLYVLLKPLNKKGKKSADESLPTSPENDPRIPSNLRQFVFKENPEETCPWSLSGPQFQKPCKIQQRYCYPKGDPEYSRIKGGSLWTKTDGTIENVNFRLLYVYYSAKRAGNNSSKPSVPLRQVKSVEMPRLQPLPTAPQTPRCDSFGSAFDDDSPLSFQVSGSPIKDTSLVSLLSRTASIDTDSEPVISPDRGFFDIQTEFDRANDIRRSVGSSQTPTNKKQKRHDNRSRESQGPMGYDSNRKEPHHHRHYNGHYHHPYWPPYHPSSMYATYSNDSHERRPGAWAYPPPSTTSFPVQQERKSVATWHSVSKLHHLTNWVFFNTTATFLILLNTKQKQNHVADFVNELKSAHSKLQEAIAKTELSRQEECIHLLSRPRRIIGPI